MFVEYAALPAGHYEQVSFLGTSRPPAHWSIQGVYPEVSQPTGDPTHLLWTYGSSHYYSGAFPQRPSGALLSE